VIVVEDHDPTSRSPVGLATVLRGVGAAAAVGLGLWASAPVATAWLDGAPVDERPGAASPLVCPSEVPDDGWVPEAPTFPGAGDRLTPPDAVGGIVGHDADRPWPVGAPSPGPGPSPIPSPLERSTDLDASAASEVAAVLHAVPAEIHPCPAVWTSLVPSLVGLRSGDGTTTWVRLGDPCNGATNGEFATMAPFDLPASVLGRGRMIVCPAAPDLPDLPDMSSLGAASADNGP
jgi:hypothetical protein